MVTSGPTTPSQSSGSEDVERLEHLKHHLSLLEIGSEQEGLGEVTTAPIFTMPVLKHTEAISEEDEEPFPQYGLLGGVADALCATIGNEDSATDTVDRDPRIFFNVAAPSSTFICGSQGSGKSHTLSCLLENCLFPSEANKLPKPLSGIVFHFDAFISDEGGSPCEAAFLASNPNIKVRVLCAPTNLRTMQASQA